jgi:hypothetical protein
MLSPTSSAGAANARVFLNRNFSVVKSHRFLTRLSAGDMKIQNLDSAEAPPSDARRYWMP